MAKEALTQTLSLFRTLPPQSAIITYDFDISVQKRKDEPEFYGFVPAGVPGGIVFACMVLNSAFLLLARSASAALLILVQPSLFLYYTLGDCAFFFLQKACRGDFRSYWKVEGLAGTVFFDCLSQLVFKLVVDYTGLVQLRGPGCLGGCYWTGNMVRVRVESGPFFPSLIHSSQVLALIAPSGAVAIYFASDASSGSNLDESTTWTLASSLCGAWVAIFLLFLLLMNSSHRHTFYSTQTCKEWVCSDFTKEGATDASKMRIHTSNHRQWQHLRGDVKEWTWANWARFEREEHEWFSAALIACVDDDMIPAGSLEGLRRAGGGQE
jgi:hypothetical protein